MKPGHINEIANRIFELLKNEGLLNNCTTCMDWNETKEICTKFNVRPPATVIVHGCEYHNLIPF